MTMQTCRDALLAAALDYAERAWPVFPVYGIRPLAPGQPELICGCAQGIEGCPSPGKHPVTPRGFKNATITEVGVESYWKSEPHNIGVDLGAGNLLVVDLDSRQAVERWNAGPFGKIRTARVSTGKGCHIYYAQDPGDWSIGSVGQSKVSQVHGLAATEVKANDGYTVVPPSRHISGRFYAWDDARMPLAPLPDALREWILSAGAPVGRQIRRSRPRSAAGVGHAWEPIRDPQAFVVASLHRLETAQPGARNDAATRAACELGQVADEDHYPRELLRRWFFDAARQCRLMIDEPVKTWDTWCRNAGDECELSEVSP